VNRPLLIKLGTLLVLVLLLGGCKTYYAAETQSSRLDTSTTTELDTAILAMVDPYRSQLELSMNVVLAELSTDLTKEQPESTLGNHVARITLEAAEREVGRDLDFAIMNYGGLRVPSINAGPLLMNDAYQIMPFDNYIVVMDLTGSQVLELLDQIAAYGGWPVQDIRFAMEEKRAVAVEIRGEALRAEETYSVALTDYLADGGDHLEMLKGIKHFNTGLLLRDAIIDYWKRIAAAGEAVEEKKDGRIMIIEHE
jgi:2',3'-cyclic-nucleotide 2'-phosphodiesterase (5'-nucleotidase family)